MRVLCRHHTMITDLCFFAINKSLGIHCECPGARSVGCAQPCPCGGGCVLRCARCASSRCRPAAGVLVWHKTQNARPAAHALGGVQC